MIGPPISVGQTMRFFVWGLQKSEAYHEGRKKWAHWPLDTTATVVYGEMSENHCKISSQGAYETSQPQGTMAG